MFSNNNEKVIVYGFFCQLNRVINLNHHKKDLKYSNE